MENSVWDFGINQSEVLWTILAFVAVHLFRKEDKPALFVGTKSKVKKMRAKGVFMIKINYLNTPEDFKIVFNGHANYAEKGKDIVCAAVSILSSELILACDDAKTRGEIVDYDFFYKEAFVSISFKYCCDSKSIRNFIAVIIKSLELLIREYGQYIELTEQRIVA